MQVCPELVYFPQAMDRAARYKSTSVSTKQGDFPPGGKMVGECVEKEKRYWKVFVVGGVVVVVSLVWPWSLEDVWMNMQRDFLNVEVGKTGYGNGHVGEQKVID